MFLGTGNSFLASRIHFEDYFCLRAETVGAVGANFLSYKTTIWGSVPMFLGTRNSFLTSKLICKEYFDKIKPEQQHRNIISAFFHVFRHGKLIFDFKEYLTI